MARLEGGVRVFAVRFMVVFLSLILISVFPLARPVSAQATQASINGVVTDTSNAILPGVTVIATGPALQVPQVETVTNERGEYRLSPLPPGTYVVTFELPGFQSVKREGVRLAVGFTATIDQSLGVGTVAESITVSGQSPLVDVTNPSTSVDMSSEGLEILPTTRDGLEGLHGAGARHAHEPGRRRVQHDRHHRDSGLRTAGRSVADARGDHVCVVRRQRRPGGHVDFNAIESTRLQTVGSSAEMPRRGQFIDSVAKSGGNEFHGELVAYGSGDTARGHQHH